MEKGLDFFFEDHQIALMFDHKSLRLSFFRSGFFYFVFYSNQKGENVNKAYRILVNVYLSFYENWCVAQNIHLQLFKRKPFSGKNKKKIKSKVKQTQKTK